MTKRQMGQDRIRINPSYSQAMRDKLTGAGLGATMETDVAPVTTGGSVVVGVEVTVVVDFVDVVDAKTDDKTVDARVVLVVVLMVNDVVVVVLVVVNVVVGNMVDAKTDDNTVDARAELAGDGAILAIPFIAQLPKLILPNSYVAPPVIPVNTTAFTRDREVVLINVLIGILIPWKVVELTAKFGTL